MRILNVADTRTTKPEARPDSINRHGGDYNVHSTALVHGTAAGSVRTPSEKKSAPSRRNIFPSDSTPHGMHHATPIITGSQ